MECVTHVTLKARQGALRMAEGVIRERDGVPGVRVRCVRCGEMTAAREGEGLDGAVCDRCAGRVVRTCAACGREFVVGRAGETVCEECGAAALAARRAAGVVWVQRPIGRAVLMVGWVAVVLVGLAAVAGMWVVIAAYVHEGGGR